MTEFKEKKEHKSVMRLEDVDTAYVSDVPISVGPEGRVSVDIIITGARTLGIRNTRENTGAAYPNIISSFSKHAHTAFVVSTSPERQKAAFFESLVAAEERVNAKHFIVTRDARSYLNALNAADLEYTDKLVKKTNLFCVDLESKREFDGVPSELKIEIVSPSDKKSCEEVSRFQQETLPSFRKLTGDENIRKTKERYDLEAFNSRVSSPEISIFTIKRGDKLLGTFTLNLHQMADVEESARFGYLSDLFVAEGLENDPAFINQFIGGVFAEITTRFPKVKVLSVMAAAGDPAIPIVKCFNHAKDGGLIKPFTRAEQERLGVVAHFTLKPENASNAHLSPQLPRAVPSHLSAVASRPSLSPAASDTVVDVSVASNSSSTVSA